MLYQYFTEKLLGLQDVKITKAEEFEKEIEISIEMKRTEHQCPCCSKKTNTIHDYRTQRIKDLQLFKKNLTLILRKRRYRCPDCGKRFFEKNTFLPRYYRMTNRLSASVIDDLYSECSFTSVAKKANLSVSTVIRIFDLVSYPKATLPENLSIDEFKGNTGEQKYQCILTDPVNKVVLDILPKRQEYALTGYFKAFSKDKREAVKSFVCDMWKPYYDSAQIWFPSATRIIDKFHWVRQVMWAFENVRKQEQKKFSNTHRRYFKHSRKLLLKRFHRLKDEQKQQVNIMLYASVNLSRAYFYKEKLLEILDDKDVLRAKNSLKEWISDASDCGIPQFEKCAATLRNWLSGILNSFDTAITNGFTEGCNNKIKVLKRNAYGYRNFKRFRNRILHMFSYQRSIQKQQTV